MQNTAHRLSSVHQRRYRLLAGFVGSDIAKAVGNTMKYIRCHIVQLNWGVFLTFFNNLNRFNYNFNTFYLNYSQQKKSFFIKIKVLNFVELIGTKVIWSVSTYRLIFIAHIIYF